MYNIWTYGDGLGETKAAILARGCVKIRQGVFRCPDGSEVSPTEGEDAPDWRDVKFTGDVYCLDPCTQQPYPASDYDHTKGPGGGVCPRTVPVGGCPPRSTTPTAPTTTPATGGGSASGSVPGSGSSGSGDSGDITAATGGSSLSFLSQPFGGIPIWAWGVGAFLLLPMLKGGRR